MRRSFPWPLSFMVSSQYARQHAAGPRRAHARHDGAADASEREEPLAVAQERQRLVAERRNGRESAAESVREEDPGALVDAAALERERHHEADDEAPEDVDRERASREVVVAELLHGTAEPVARDAADDAAERDEQRALQPWGHGPSMAGDCARRDMPLS